MTISVSPLDVSPWVTRITAQCSLIRYVGRAADNLSAIENGPKSSPSVFVLEPSYTPIGKPNAANNSLIQMLGFQIGVLTVCQNYGDAVGAQAAADNYAARSQVWQALIGWNFAADGFTVSAGTGKLIQYKNNFLYYLDTYNLQVQIRNTP